MKYILTDIDDTVLDWSGEFEKWVREHHIQFKDVEKHLTDVHDIELWLNCDIDFSRMLIKDFNAYSNNMFDLAPTRDSEEIINKLNAQGYKFIAITAIDDLPELRETRKKCLEKYFGNAFDTLICTGYSASKKPILDRYKPSYWLDDKTKHVVDGADCGHTSFLINYEHNSECDDKRVKRIHGWKDFYDLI